MASHILLIINMKWVDILNTIYRKKNYSIYKVKKNQYIVHNTNKIFKEGHTHINNYHAAKMIIQLSITKTIPLHLSKYLLESIIRISEDENYIRCIRNMI